MKSSENWDKYTSGVVLADGYLNAPLIDLESKGVADRDFLPHKPLTGEVESKANVSVETFPDRTSRASG